MAPSNSHDGFLEAKDSHPAKIVWRISLEQGCNLKEQNNATTASTGMKVNRAVYASVKRPVLMNFSHDWSVTRSTASKK
jgi:hypothetical protein